MRDGFNPKSTFAAADKAELDALVGKRAKAIAGNSRGSVAAFKELYNLSQERRPINDSLAEELQREYPDISDTAERLSGFGS